MKGEFRIKKQKIRVNERIYADEVRLISENKEQIGVVTVSYTHLTLPTTPYV